MASAVPGYWVVRASSGLLGSNLRGVSVMAAVPFDCGQGAQTFPGALPVHSILSVLMAGGVSGRLGARFGLLAPARARYNVTAKGLP
ncbi:hypothetical protein SRABI26_01649 [Arthrobacter sp. Bi26]|nr:hypothetical protein SRABI26_01649 [Arthrobacter sp. Bi26]